MDRFFKQFIINFLYSSFESGFPIKLSFLAADVNATKFTKWLHILRINTKIGFKKVGRLEAWRLKKGGI